MSKITALLVSVLACVLLLCVTVASAADSRSEVVSRIAAVVNDEIITTRQLKEHLQEQPTEMGITQDQMLQNMITDILMEQRAVQIGVEVSQADIDRAVKDVEQQNDITTEQLQQALEAQGMSMQQYYAQLKSQILRFKLTGIEVKSKADVTNREVRDYYTAHMDDYQRPAQIRLSRISLPLGSQGNATYAQAEAMRKELVAGRSVEEIVAAQPATLQVDGGDMGYFKPGELSPVFNEALAGLKAGQVTDILQSADVLHLLRVEESSSGRVAAFEEVKDEISAQLQRDKMEETYEAWRKGLRENAYVEIRL
ncbi:MAG: peptidyl-prolyl cis-trans isomerase [Desulfuromonadaceae bacterium]|nr:peptidyl-prolyl cis-trans isomerase [Desulfuromonadaceae bacterium]